LNATVGDENKIVVPRGFDKTGLAITKKIKESIGDKYEVFYFPFK